MKSARSYGQQILPLLVLAAAEVAMPAERAASPPAVVATPRAQSLSGATPLKAMPESRPLLPVIGKATVPQAYLEQEFLVSGWAGTGAERRPVTTRLLVARPVKPELASGRVILEALSASAEGEFADLWRISSAHFQRRGDAWVGVTVKPEAISALHAADATRYSKLLWPMAAAGACENTNPDAVTLDLMLQSAVLLRSASKENPLVTLNIHTVIGAGFGAATTAVLQLAGLRHQIHRRVGGARIFDGYLLAGADFDTATREPCAAIAGKITEPQIPAGAPLVILQAVTRTDPPAWLAAASTSADVRVHRLVGRCATHETQSLLATPLNALWQQLAERVAQGLPLAESTSLQKNALGNLRLDANGLPLGGWRTPEFNWPLSIRRARDGQPFVTDLRFCDADTTTRPMTVAELKKRYGSRAAFLKIQEAGIAAALVARQVTVEDAARLRAALRTVPVF